MKLYRTVGSLNGVPTFLYFNQKTGEQLFELYQDSDWQLVEQCLQACGISISTTMREQ